VTLLAERGVVAGGATRIETPLAVRDVTWEIASQTATVELPAPELGPVLGDGRAELLSALGLGEGDLADGPDRPVQVVSTARPKLMVPLCDEARLDALEPDHPRLWEVCEALGATGVYAFVAAQGLHLAARQFPVRAGYVEDAATGVAASALAGYLVAHADRPVAARWRTWTVAQGRAMGRPSVMEAGAHIDAGGTVTATRVRGRMRRMTAAERAAA
jgi:trans-2,3-dihydro-3-hydroxyanthranilate isomerase